MNKINEDDGVGGSSGVPSTCNMTSGIDINDKELGYGLERRKKKLKTFKEFVEGKKVE